MIEFALADTPVEMGYQRLSTHTLLEYLDHCGEVAAILGGRSSHWRAAERGDGNLNLVFLVEGPSGAVIVKQALPYVRMVGPSWPLALCRAHFEQRALREQARWAASFVPAVIRTDADLALTVMDYLTPHVVLRKALLAGQQFPQLGTHMGQFLARTAFHTSDLFLKANVKRAFIGNFIGNTAMCKISEDLIFDEPYFGAPRNRHTSPHLDETILRLQHDLNLKFAVQELKWAFLNQCECLMHGDLHTGSIMVTDTDTRVIDPEFACYGPMGFDMGMLLGNLLLAYCAQRGHEREAGDRETVRRYLLDSIAQLWRSFRAELVGLNRKRADMTGGDAYPARVLSLDSSVAERAIEQLMARIFSQALGFAGCEMIRRIVGLAHVEDLESIGSLAKRSACEHSALILGSRLLLDRGDYRCIQDVVDAAACA